MAKTENVRNLANDDIGTAVQKKSIAVLILLSVLSPVTFTLKCTKSFLEYNELK